MKTNFRLLLLILSLCLMTAGVAQRVFAEDIDIFIGDSSGSNDNPNVLIILDNSSNWAASNQNWPKDGAPPVACGNDCDKQGYYELKSLRTVINTLPTDSSGTAKVNVGLMLFNNSNATNDGGYVRFAIKELTQANKQAFLNTIDKIISNFNTETAASSVQYSAALFDAFKYYGGYTDVVHAKKDQQPSASPSFSGIPIFGTKFWGSNNKDGDKPDFDNAYHDNEYVPPKQTTCGKNYIIFIGNGFPASESSNPDLRGVLKYLNDAANPLGSITEFPLASYSCSGTWVNNSSCYSSDSACATAKPADSASTLYQCAKSTCSGNQKLVQKCTSVTATFTTPSANAANRYGDEFTDFLFRTDVSSTVSQQNVFTYTIDVFKDHPDLNQTALLRNMAKYGGGQYYTANNEGGIIEAMKEIFAEITSVNSTFASASLPVNATNRTQNENQVFIAMFRPDPNVKPRWFGNLKRYQLINDMGSIELGDQSGAAAVNSQTGFIKDCAASFWTVDSGDFWKDYTVNPNPASACVDSAGKEYSDMPDGPRVESGAVAETIRMGNNPGATASWKVNRTIYGTDSVGSTSMTPLASLSTLSTAWPNLQKWVLGYDVGSNAPAYNPENGNTSITRETRASVHGDVVHSRPLPINYGSGGVMVYYGSNDGLLRSVDAATGKENWAFIPYEFNSRLKRLQDNQPLISYPNVSTTITPTPIPKDYFWDGTMGVYQNKDNSNVWVYPTMRRGGRMIYALDVTDPAKPSIKWKAGCPNLANDSDCIGDAKIGQTWSTPNVAFIKGYASGTKPVVVVGGGYDACEDQNTATPSCDGSSKGNVVYILDGADGSVIASFSTSGRVAADVALIDVDNDSKVDFAYAADTKGNIYRINFVDPVTKAALTSWSMSKIAKMQDGSGRKFLYPPALLQASGNKIYLAIGSGDRERPLLTDYPYASVTNRFYVFVDDTTKTDTRNIDDTASMFNYTSSTSCSTTGVLPDSTMSGWFMDLNQNGKGEQTVTSAVIVGGLVTFSTNRPIPASSGTCSTALGEARGYWVNLFNGSGAINVSGSCDGNRSSIFLGGGLPPSPVLGTVPIDGKPTTVVIGAPQKEGGSSSQYSPQQVKPIIKSKRKMKYWKSSGDH